MGLKRYIEKIDVGGGYVAGLKRITDYVCECLTDSGVVYTMNETATASVYTAVFDFDEGFINGSIKIHNNTQSVWVNGKGKNSSSWNSLTSVQTALVSSATSFNVDVCVQIGEHSLILSLMPGSGEPRFTKAAPIFVFSRAVDAETAEYSMCSAFTTSQNYLYLGADISSIIYYTPDGDTRGYSFSTGTTKFVDRPIIRSVDYIMARLTVPQDASWVPDEVFIPDRVIRGFFYDDSGSLHYGFGYFFI